MCNNIVDCGELIHIMKTNLHHWHSSSSLDKTCPYLKKQHAIYSVYLNDVGGA